MTDFDNPWKVLTELYFQDFTALFWREAYLAIDWAQPVIPLTTELPPFAARDEIGRRVADKLFGVRLVDGKKCLLLIHLEFQNQVDPDFAERMAVYNFKIYVQFGHEVVSMAVLGDKQPQWRPNVFQRGDLGFHHRMEFPIIKLSDYVGPNAPPIPKENVFGVAVLAHFEAMRRSEDPEQRTETKLALFREIKGRGYDSQQLETLFRFVDLMIDLPREWDLSFIQQIKLELREDTMDVHEFMTFETSFDRYFKHMAREEGKAEGLKQGIQIGRKDALYSVFVQCASQKFGALPKWADPIIQTADQNQIAAWLLRLSEAESAADLLVPRGDSRHD